MIDPISLVACIAAIVSAFHAASALFHGRFHGLRKKFLSGKRLMKLLRDSPEVTQQEFERCHTEFGDQFSKGDGKFQNTHNAYD